MLERLKKCLTPYEIEAINTLISNKCSTISLSINKFASDNNFSPCTVHDAIRLLEVAGLIETEKSYKCTLIKVKKRKLIEQLIKESML